MRVHDRSDIAAGVHAEVQPELGGGDEGALEHLARHRHQRHVVGGALAEHHARGGHRDPVAVPGGDVARRTDEQALGRQPAPAAATSSRTLTAPRPSARRASRSARGRPSPS